MKQQLRINEKTVFDSIIVKRFFKALFSVFFKLSGWKVTPFSLQSSGIAIAAPHTSNWDFIYALGAAISQDLKIYFSIKESWCHIPIIGRFMLWLGAIPITRTPEGNGQVEMIRQFIQNSKNKQTLFLFTPEGTRADVNKWRTGFYHLAVATNLPIYLGKLDYLNKEAGLFHCFNPTKNKENDIVFIQAAYALIGGKFQDLQYPKYTQQPENPSDNEANLLYEIYQLGQQGDYQASSKKAPENRHSLIELEKLTAKGLLTSEGETGYKLSLLGRGTLLHHFHYLPKPNNQ